MSYRRVRKKNIVQVNTYPIQNQIFRYYIHTGLAIDIQKLEQLPATPKLNPRKPDVHNNRWLIKFWRKLNLLDLQLIVILVLVLM